MCTNVGACSAASTNLLAIANCLPLVPAVPALLFVTLQSRLESDFMVLQRSFVSHQGSALQSADDMLHHHTPSPRLLISEDHILSPLLRTKHRSWSDAAFSIPLSRSETAL
ncbi:unnamed protein product [Pleuronectes platessa]|uniref:Uncharacterized protein n=1 Tax=Pleuronectes platessa TaxID=8262 RepID=A0A9N7YW16_PLEPL|nr:unnamed protein product [Pleuronectes platessa]